MFCEEAFEISPQVLNLVFVTMTKVKNLTSVSTSAAMLQRTQVKVKNLTSVPTSAEMLKRVQLQWKSPAPVAISVAMLQRL